MNTILGTNFDFSDVPVTWPLCFCEACPRHQECLRFLVGTHVPQKLTWGPAIYPSAYQGGDCPHYKQPRIIKAAYGFRLFFRDVKQRDYTLLRDQMKAYLGGHGTYYRYNRGERLLTPEQQQWIRDLFASHGYDKDVDFEGYRNVLDFS